MKGSIPFASVIEVLNTTIQGRKRFENGKPQAAVLVPFLKIGGEAYLLLTKRATTLRTHSGQVSFPGGKIDKMDENVIAAALRETNEEVGITPEKVSIIGLFDDFATPYYRSVTPVIGYITNKKGYVRSEAEIDEVMEVPLIDLINPSIHRTEIRRYGNLDYTIHFYDWVSPSGKSYTIWGATAGVITKLLTIIKNSSLLIEEND